VWPRNSRAHAERTAALNRRRREETKRAPEFSRRSTRDDCDEHKQRPLRLIAEKT
jgi:hypothetical protein